MRVVDAWGVRFPEVVAYKDSTVCVNPDLVIGYELEVENCAHNASYYTKVGDKTNFGVTLDNSLRGNAFEFISRPMKSTHALSALSEFLKSAGFTTTNYSDRCSVHIHVNCTNLELEQVNAISLLYTVFEDILFEFVGHDRDSNIYCIPWNQCRLHFDLIQNFLSDSNAVLRRWNKYTALNLLPLHTQGTIEFRQMHGTADMDKLTTWTNIIGAICKTAVETPLNDLIAQIKELNNTSQYEAFFMQTLAGQLPYNETYSRRMEEGVIFAKFTLMNMTEKKTIKPKKSSPAPVAQAPARPNRYGIDPNANTIMRNVPFPRPGATIVSAEEWARVNNMITSQPIATQAQQLRDTIRFGDDEEWTTTGTDLPALRTDEEAL